MVETYIWVENWLRRNLRRQEGQALSEYGVILALVLVACIGAIIAFREKLVAMFNEIAGSI